jgi:hypothetical protein
MTTIRIIDCRLRRRGVRGVPPNDAGGGAFIGVITCVGLTSAGDGARRILLIGRVSGDRRAEGSWSVGGSWRPADGSRWVSGSGAGGLARPRQSG